MSVLHTCYPSRFCVTVVIKIHRKHFLKRQRERSKYKNSVYFGRILAILGDP